MLTPGFYLISNSLNLACNMIEMDSEEAFLCSLKYHYQHYQRAPLFAHVRRAEKKRRSINTLDGLRRWGRRLNWYSRIFETKKLYLVRDELVTLFGMKRKRERRGRRGGGKRRLAQTRKCASVDKALREWSKTAPSELVEAAQLRNALDEIGL